MPQVINTNISSLNAQRNLNMSQTSLATSLQRLSSGLRINSAKDDAAGLAISQRFTTQIAGLNQAVRNANDGISLAQTAESALSEVTNNLQRIRELAVQAVNATNSSSDRAALNLEVQQRLSEIDRAASQTSFNGQKVLDGSFGNASFQVGANAGETITLSLSASVRLNAVGQIATAVGQALGSNATGGSIAVSTTAVNFGTAASDATAGSLTVNAATRNFGTAGAGQVDGTSATMTHGTLNYGTAYVAQVDGYNNQTVTGYDFSGAGLAQFDVDGIGVTLTTNLVDDAGLKAELESQLAGYTVTINGLGDIDISKDGSLAAVAISNADANAVTAGFANSAGTAGTAATPTTNATFKVDGTLVTLDQDYADTAAIAADILSQLSGYTATVNEGADTIQLSKTGSTAAVAITEADANAIGAGFVNSAGTAGSAAVTTTNATFTIAGHALTLNTDYASFDAMAADLESKLDTASAGDNFTVTNNAGALTFTRNATGVASTAIDITVSDSVATAAGLGVVAGTAGADAVATTNASFKVDGTIVTLNQNYADLDAVAADIEAQLTGYTVTADVGSITITNDTLGSDGVVISEADGVATAAGFADATGTAGTAGGSITLADFSLQVGETTAVSFNGTYATAQAFADAINANASGVYAQISGGALKLTSSADLTLSGDDAQGYLGFASTSITADSGSLASASVLTVQDANDTIQRVDAALTGVNDLRSTFGAIQNRFESVISSLSASSENLTASRSRIMDADFASEVASLTRTQILQQAGVAMLAQANALPNNVLALLRG